MKKLLSFLPQRPWQGLGNDAVRRHHKFMNIHIILIVFAMTLITSVCDAADLSAAERATLRDYAKSPATVKETARICLRHKLTKGQILDYLGDTYRVEVQKRQMDFFYAPSQILTIHLDKDGVVEKVSAAGFELSRDQLNEIRIPNKTAHSNTATDNSPAAIAAAKERGAASAAKDIKAGTLHILYFGKPWSAGKPLVDDATGYRVQILEGCDVTEPFVAEVGAYNSAVRAFHAKNPSAAAPLSEEEADLAPKQNKHEVEPSAPKVSSVEALRRAEDYVAEQKIDVSKHFVSSVRYMESGSWTNSSIGKGPYWQVTYELVLRHDGGQRFILIYMDGKIGHIDGL